MRPYWQLLRPATLPFPILFALLFGYWAWLEHGGELWRIGISAFVLASANAASNVVNQVFDVDIDRLAKPHRPLPAGRIPPDHALSLGVVLYGLVLVLAFSVFGTLYGLVVGAILLLTWLYSAPPRLRKRFVWSNASLATPRGGLGLVAAYAAFGDPLQPTVLLAAVGFGLYVFGANTAKDFPDEAADRKCGVRNLVTVLGTRAAAWVATVFVWAGFVVLASAGRFAWWELPASAAVAFAVQVSLLAAPRARRPWPWAVFMGGAAVLGTLYVL